MIKKLLMLVLALFAAAAFASTEVNTATPAELDTVKGIGPAIAAKIVDERKKGAFKDWGDLITRVKGIGNKNSAEFSAAGLTVNGAALTGAPATAVGTRKTAVTAAPAATPTATTTAPAPAPAAATTSAADKKAAARQEREDKKAAKKAAKAASAASSASAKK